MKELFNIDWNGITAKADMLVCELSHYHICLATVADNTISRLVFYESKTPITQRNLLQVWNEKVQDKKSFKTLLVGSAFPDYTLVPQKLSEEKDLKSFLNEQSFLIFTDNLPMQQAQIIYGLPHYLMQELDKGQLAQVMHVHTAALQQFQAEENNNHILLHFGSKEFRVVALKNGKLQLAQIYPFTAPLDVVYYLLMISSQYNMPQAETTIVLSGLLDEASALYKELFQYYTQVQFARQAMPIQTNEYYPHYFSSILNLAACASSVAI